MYHIKHSKAERKTLPGDTGFTDGLCNALIIKKEVYPERFQSADPDDHPALCPRECHACCKLGIILDLTSVEALLIYLLNRDVVHLIDEYTTRHDPSPFCPFMIMDKCIINSYKPSACQMYMPFEFNGEPACYYLAAEKTGKDFIGSTACSMHSNSYAIHGFMLLAQQNLDPYMEQSWFKNIYDGTAWWQEHYDALPKATRTDMESIINEDTAGLLKTENFKFEASLATGFQTYNETVSQHEIFLSDASSKT